MSEIIMWPCWIFSLEIQTFSFQLVQLKQEKQQHLLPLPQPPRTNTNGGKKQRRGQERESMSKVCFFILLFFQNVYVHLDYMYGSENHVNDDQHQH